VKEGIMLRNTEIFGKMDPFLEFHHKSEMYRTKSASDGGSNPKWNSHMLLPIDNFDEAIIKIRCFDDDVLSNDLIGEG
jgi:Ca2+-dependent lipid-binding protein